MYLQSVSLLCLFFFCLLPQQLKTSQALPQTAVKFSKGIAGKKGRREQQFSKHQLNIGESVTHSCHVGPISLALSKCTGKTALVSGSVSFCFGPRHFSTGK